MAKKKYLTEEERLEAKRANNRKWKAEHKLEIAEYKAKYRQNHKDEIAKYRAKYRNVNTKDGRARRLIETHKQEDKKYGRGECDITVPWFIRNIFTKCIYCGETDWKKLGCDRIDNSLPHTIENVVPSCMSCNRKRHKKPFEQFYWNSKHKTLGNES